MFETHIREKSFFFETYTHTKCIQTNEKNCTASETKELTQLEKPMSSQPSMFSNLDIFCMNDPLLNSQNHTEVLRSLCKYAKIR